jgi:FkbM family methyltransferase
MFTSLWALIRNRTIHSDGRIWPWPERHYLRNLNKWLFRLRERTAKEVVISDGKARYRFRCQNYTEFARCMKMFLKEPGTCEWIKTQVEPGEVFYDIGANIGVYTVLAAQRVGPSGKVFAFEPHSATFARLLETISMNRLSGTVTACNFALHERQGFYPFHYDSAEAGSSQSQLMPQLSNQGGGNAAKASELKFSASIDSLMAVEGFLPPDHVKIDVDGNELLILRGMHALLSNRRHPKSIQVEINADQRPDVMAYMQVHGYVPVKEHHTRKGAELFAAGKDPEHHAYNVIFKPTAG